MIFILVFKIQYGQIYRPKLYKSGNIGAGLKSNMDRFIEEFVKKL